MDSRCLETHEVDGLGDWGLCSDWVMTWTRDIGVLGLLNTTAACWRGDDGLESVMIDLSSAMGLGIVGSVFGGSAYVVSYYQSSSRVITYLLRGHIHRRRRTLTNVTQTLDGLVKHIHGWADLADLTVGFQRFTCRRAVLQLECGGPIRKPPPG